MTPERIFLECYRLGIELDTDGERVLFCPADQLPPELRETMREHKADLIEFLHPAAWLQTPLGAAKIIPALRLDDGRQGVVLRTKPDRVTFVRAGDIRLTGDPVPAGAKGC